MIANRFTGERGVELWGKGELWLRHAACRDVDPDLFFPHPTDGAGHKAAKEVCARCPVIGRCRDLADHLEARSGVTYGVWAGESPPERRRRRRSVPPRLYVVEDENPSPNFEEPATSEGVRRASLM